MENGTFRYNIMTSCCLKTPERIHQELSTPIKNGSYIENFDSELDVATWKRFYYKWLQDQKFENQTIFDYDTTDRELLTVYDHDGDGVADNFTLNDPRLLKVRDTVYNKDYYVFYKDCKKMVYYDGTLGEKDGYPIEKTVYHDVSQTLRDIIYLEDMDTVRPEELAYKEKIYEDYYDCLDNDVKMLRKTDMQYYPNNPLKALVLNKMILKLQNPLENPLLIDDYDSGVEVNPNNFVAADLNGIQYVIPPQLNKAIYDQLMEQYAEENDDPFYPTFLQEDDTNYDPEAETNDDWFVDDKDLQEKIDNGEVVVIETDEAPIVVIKKTTEEITYYNPDTGEIHTNVFEYTDLYASAVILELNSYDDEFVGEIKNDLLDNFRDKMDDRVDDLDDARDRIAELKSALITALDYLDPETCFRINAAWDYRGLDQLLKLLNFADCFIANLQDFLIALATLADIQKLLNGLIASGLIQSGLMDRLDDMADWMSSYPSILGGDFSWNTEDFSLIGEAGFDTECILAKTLLDDMLREGYDTLKNMVNNGVDDMEEYTDAIEEIKNQIAGDGIKQCLKLLD
jgi:hypothetical protein